jgi:hypothetical protein
MPYQPGQTGRTGQKAKRTANLVFQTKLALLAEPEGLSDIELAERLKVSLATAKRYRLDVNAIKTPSGKWSVEPTEDEIKFALAIIRRIPAIPIK